MKSSLQGVHQNLLLNNLIFKLKIRNFRPNWLFSSSTSPFHFKFFHTRNQPKVQQFRNPVFAI